jgi:hypothetical protein
LKFRNIKTSSKLTLELFPRKSWKWSWPKLKTQGFIKGWTHRTWNHWWRKFWCNPRYEGWVKVIPCPILKGTILTKKNHQFSWWELALNN